MAHGDDMKVGSEEGIWVFGYGSLVWKQGFEFTDSVWGCVKGWKRRFWQASPDHRGTVENPGRVVTLLRWHVQEDIDICTEDIQTYGRCFYVPSHAVAATMAYLDIREINGYEKILLDVHCKDGRVINALVFSATPANVSFRPGELLPDIARVIVSSVGPSGSNLEYLANLCVQFREQGLDDEHLFALEKEVTRQSAATAAGGGAAT